MPTKWRVEVTGLRQVFNALEEWDKSASRRIVKEITQAADRVAKTAGMMAPNENPVSNWGGWTFSRDGRDLGFNPSVVKAGFKKRQNNYRRAGIKAGIAWEAYQSNAGGNIFEVMGTGSGATPSARTLIDTVGRRFGGTKARTRPRTLIPAYYSVMTPELRDGIRQMIENEAKKAGLV